VNPLLQLEVSRAIHCHQKEKVEIIQRNGIAFHWPQSEVA
jgi:hypothetical protein